MWLCRTDDLSSLSLDFSMAQFEVMWKLRRCCCLKGFFYRISRVWAVGKGRILGTSLEVFKNNWPSFLFAFLYLTPDTSYAC